MAYAEGGPLPIAAAAVAAGISESHFSRFIDKKAGPEDPALTWEQLWAIADACVISRDWFSADLDRLEEIVPEGMPRFGAVTPTARRAAQQRLAARQEEALRERERHEAERDTKPAPRRRTNRAK